MRLETRQPFWMLASAEFVVVYLSFVLYAHRGRVVWLVLAGLWAWNLFLTLRQWARAWRYVREVERREAEWWAEELERLGDE